MNIVLDGAFGQDGRIIQGLIKKDQTLKLHIITHKDRITHPSLYTNCDFETWYWNSENYSCIKNILSKIKPDLYINLASLNKSAAEMSVSNSIDGFFGENYRRTAIIVTALNKVAPNCHFSYASSRLVFKPYVQCRKIFATSYPEPDVPYAVAKERITALLNYYRQNLKFSSSVFILFNHDSEFRQGGFLLSKIAKYLSTLLESSATKKKLFINNIGEKYDLSSAHDVAEKMVAASIACKQGNYVLASGRSVVIRDILDWSFSLFSLNWRDYVEFELDQENPYAIGCEPDPFFEKIIKEKTTKDIIEKTIYGLVQKRNSSKNL